MGKSGFGGFLLAGELGSITLTLSSLPPYPLTMAQCWRSAAPAGTASREPATSTSPPGGAGRMRRRSAGIMGDTWPPS